ncbi:MAG: hypothetical protein N2055_08705 [Tepidimonas taiwanensis]|nr:hypothetical protein [Tepidimonas taiwanensis]
MSARTQTDAAALTAARAALAVESLLRLVDPRAQLRAVVATGTQAQAVAALREARQRLRSLPLVRRGEVDPALVTLAGEMIVARLLDERSIADGYQARKKG